MHNSAQHTPYQHLIDLINLLIYKMLFVSLQQLHGDLFVQIFNKIIYKARIDIPLSI